MTEYLEIKNWQQYQHYKNRNPPWIKLHAKLLNDRTFTALSCASRGLLMQLWIIASENSGRIENDVAEIKYRLRDNKIKQEDINILIDKGFLNGCKHVLASAPKKPPETETETETEKIVLPLWLKKGLWADFLKHRRDMKKAMSPLTQSKMISKLKKMHKDGHNIEDILNNSIANGWQGVFEVKDGTTKQKPKYAI